MAEMDDVKRIGRLPAFPLDVLQTNGRPDIYGGLTKREYAAVAAMQGILASPNDISVKDDDGYDKTLALLARAAVMCADDLLAELAKEPTR